MALLEDNTQQGNVQPGSQLSLRGAAGGRGFLGRTPEDVSRSAGTPSPMRQAIASSLMGMGFTQLGLSQTSGVRGAELVGMGEGVVSVIQNNWWQKEHTDFMNNEYAQYIDMLRAAEAKLRYATTPVVGEDGEPGLPIGPPGPEGEPPKTIPLTDPRVWGIWQNANAQMANDMMQATMQVYAAGQAFRNNPLVRDTMGAMFQVQSAWMEQIADNYGERKWDAALEREREQEGHESIISLRDAQEDQARAGAAESRARTRRIEGEGNDIRDELSWIMKNRAPLYDRIFEIEAAEARKLTAQAMKDAGDAKNIKDARQQLHTAALLAEKGEVPDEKMSMYLTRMNETATIRTARRAVKELGRRDWTDEEIDENLEMFKAAVAPTKPLEGKPAEEEEESGLSVFLGRAAEMSAIRERLQDKDIDPVERVELETALETMSQQQLEAAKEAGKAGLGLAAKPISMFNERVTKIRRKEKELKEDALLAARKLGRDILDKEEKEKNKK